MKIEYPAPSHRSKTRKGVQPNVPGEKLVNVMLIETGFVERVKRSVAEARVATGKWRFAKKNEATWEPGKAKGRTN